MSEAVGTSAPSQPFSDAKRDEVRRKRARKLIDAIQDEHPEWRPSMREAEDLIVQAYANRKSDPQIRARLLAPFGGVRKTGAAITKRLRELSATSAPRRSPEKPARSRDQDAADAAFLDQLGA